MNSKIITEILKVKPYSSLYHMGLPKVGGGILKSWMGSNKNYFEGGHKFCVNDIPNESFITWTESGIKFFPSYLDDRQFSRSVTFAVIRNPFDWLVSYYYHYSGYFHKNTEHRGSFGCVDYHGFGNFNEFIDAYCDPLFKWHIPPLKNFIPSQLFDKNGKCRADFILLNEDLNETIDTVAQHFDFRLNHNTSRMKYNFMKPKREFIYNNELIDKVRLKCKRELELFGYDYKGWDESKVKLPYDGVCIDMTKVKYDIYNDKLVINDKLYKTHRVENNIHMNRTFWPQFHFQKAELLFSEKKYLMAKKEIDLVINMVIDNPDYLNKMTSLSEDELLLGIDIRGFHSPGTMTKDYLKLKTRIEEKINEEKKSNIFKIYIFLKKVFRRILRLR